MIVLITGHGDPAGPQLAQAILRARRSDHSSPQPHSVVILTPRDLAQPGWQLTTPGSGAGSFVAESRIHAETDIDLVVCLIGRVHPTDLTWIAPQDREYVAAESTAFLHYWLATLGDRSMLPPTAGNLAGPNLSVPQWVQLAGGEIRFAAYRSDSQRDSDREPLIDIALIDGRPLDARSYPENDHNLNVATRLYLASKVPYLRTAFTSTAELFAVSVIPPWRRAAAHPAIAAHIAATANLRSRRRWAA